MNTPPPKSNPSPRGFLRGARAVLHKILLRNFLKKFASFVVAIGLFLYFEMSNIQEKIFSVPLRVRLPANTTLVNELPTKVSFYLSGSRGHLDSFDPNSLEAKINISRIHRAPKRYRLIASGNIPESIQLLRIVPSEVEVHLDQLISKVVEVTPEFIHEVAKEHTNVGYAISPKRIRIRGPNDIIESIVSLNTQPISLKDLKETTEVETTISKNINDLIKFNKERLYKVKIHISPKHEVLSFPNPIPIEVVGLEPELQLLKPSPMPTITNVQYQFLEGKTNLNQSSKIQALADLKGIAEAGIYEISITLKTPKNWKLISYEPKIISVELGSKTTSVQGQEATDSEPKKAETNDNKRTIDDID